MVRQTIQKLKRREIHDAIGAGPRGRIATSRADPVAGLAHGIAIKTTDPFKADTIRQALNEVLKPPNMAVTWMDLNQQMFDARDEEGFIM